MKRSATLVSLSFLLTMAVSAVSADPIGALSLSVSPQPLSASEAQDIRVDITIVNNSKEPMPLAKSNAVGRAEFNYTIKVTRLDRRPVTDTDYARSLKGSGTQAISNSNRLVYLKPGESTSDSFVLNRMYDVSKPGVYLVQVQQAPVAGKTVTPQSNTVQIVVK